MKKNVIVTVAVLLLLLSTTVFAESGFDFVNQELTDIVYAISLSRKFPVVCDDTVQGVGSFRFSSGSFETAFDSFLLANRLYVDKEKDRWIVSRMKVTFGDTGKLTLDACDVLPERIFEGLSLKGEQVVLWDALPAVPVSVHTANVTAAQACEQVLSQFEGYAVTDQGSTIRITRSAAPFSAGAAFVTGGAPQLLFTRTGENLYSGTITDASFNDLLSLVSQSSGFQYSSLVSQDTHITDCVFEDRSLSWCLDLFCAKSGVTWTCHDGLYLFSPEENRQWHQWILLYADRDVVANQILTRFPGLELQCMGTAVSACVSAEEAAVIAGLVSVCDVPAPAQVVALNHITAEEFLTRLPPGYERNQFSPAGSEYTLFFSGSQSQYARLQTLLSTVDIPSVPVSYDLLIIQTQKNKATSFGLTSAGKTLEKGEKSGFSAKIAPGLQFNIDVAGLFGATFAERLQAAVTDNTAQIFADTRLYGISGVPISFRNTTTYRYRDPYFSADTGSKVDTGVTREIVSGLVLDIRGTVSGDKSITTEVTASVSRQGMQDASSKSNPPATSEKAVTTRVRGKSGEIIVLTGLVQDDSTNSVTGIPGASNWKVIGWMFGNKEKTSEKNEMVIYLIPHVSGEEENEL